MLFRTVPTWDEQRQICDALLERINVMTKYPSISMLHNLERGKPIGRANFPLLGPEDMVDITEKIDGVNTRIIVVEPQIGDSLVFIGSRDELLYCVGDTFASNHVKGVVRACAKYAQRFFNALLQSREPNSPMGVVVLYGESYGWGIAGDTHSGAQYSDERADFRAFDAGQLWPDAVGGMLEWSIESLAQWRDSISGSSGGWHWFRRPHLETLCDAASIPIVPLLCQLRGKDLPRSVDEAQRFLSRHIECGSQAMIDDGGLGRMEGIVLRNEAHTFAAKLRAAEYLGQPKRPRKG